MPEHIIWMHIIYARLIQANRKEKHQRVQTDDSTELPSDMSLYDNQQELILKLKKFFWMYSSVTCPCKYGESGLQSQLLGSWEFKATLSHKQDPKTQKACCFYIAVKLQL